MSVKRLFQTFLIVTVLFVTPYTALSSSKLIVAVNGGGAELIDNTLVATVDAFYNDVQHLELPVAMTSDEQLIIFDDFTLNRLTNVAELFPEKKTEEGDYHPIDFSLTEIRQLRLRNVFEEEPTDLTLGIPTLQETLSLIKRLDTIHNKTTSLVIEIKYPWYYKDSGKDLSRELVYTLIQFGYGIKEDQIYLASFDPEELQRIKTELLPEQGVHLKLIQLVDEKESSEAKQKVGDTWQPYSYDWLFTNIGLRLLASYGSILALPAEKLVGSINGAPIKEFIENTHNYGLKVVVYSKNNFKEDLPELAADISSLLEFLYTDLGVDGIYTADYQKVQRYSRALQEKQRNKNSLPPFFSNLQLSQPNTELPTEEQENGSVE